MMMWCGVRLGDPPHCWGKIPCRFFFAGVKVCILHDSCGGTVVAIRLVKTGGERVMRCSTGVIDADTTVHSDEELLAGTIIFTVSFAGYAELFG